MNENALKVAGQSPEKGPTWSFNYAQIKTIYKVWSVKDQTLVIKALC
jgi:hypothetical protein